MYQSFGGYSRWLTQEEKKRPRYNCPTEVMSLVLLLRRFLPDVDGVFYKTDREYDSSDGCMSETTIYLYRRPERSAKQPVLTEYLSIVHDGASTIYLPAKLTALSDSSEDYWPHNEGSNSFGSITSIGIFDGNKWNYRITPKQAIVRIIKDITRQYKGAHLRVSRIGEPLSGNYQLEVWRKGFPTLTLGNLYANEGRSYWFTRFLHNCVLDLR
jgi:hypothetical protein